MISEEEKNIDEILDNCIIEYHKGIDILTPAITPEFIVKADDDIFKFIDKEEFYKCWMYHDLTPNGIKFTRIVKVETSKDNK